MKNKKVITIITIIIALIIILFGTTGCMYEYMNEQQVTCTVDDKWIKRSLILYKSNFFLFLILFFS